MLPKYMLSSSYTIFSFVTTQKKPKVSNPDGLRNARETTVQVLSVTSPTITYIFLYGIFYFVARARIGFANPPGKLLLRPGGLRKFSTFAKKWCFLQGFRKNLTVCLQKRSLKIEDFTT